MITRHEFPHNRLTFTVYLCLQGWLFISITCSTEHQQRQQEKGTRWRLRSPRRLLLRRLFPFQVKRTLTNLVPVQHCKQAMVLVSTPQVTPPYFVCYFAGHGNFWMHYDERYHGGCHRASFYLANKKAGLLDLYSITHVTVVDPIRAKSCRSLRSLFCGRSVIALPVDNNEKIRG
jgi:hypothetical protein